MGTIERGRGARRRRGWIALAVCVVVGGAGAGTAQAPQALSRLTVAPEALPGGCALESVEPVVSAPSRVESPTIRMWSREVFPANPWSGTEPRFVAIVRAAIEPSPRVPRPDGQLIEAGAAPEFLTARAAGVIEAYRAVYLSTDGHRVQVSAVTFDDEALVRGEPVSALTNPPRGMSSRFVRGATVAVVAAPAPDACARVVEAHVRSII
jgi:hypothetical protein